MRIRLPTSQAALRFRISILDFICIVASPLIALFLRDAYILNYANIVTVVDYWIVWVAFSLICFFALRLYDGLAHHFSVHDAIDVIKAVVFTELLTCLAFFTVSRLAGIPRSAIIIHALILAAALIGNRVIAQAVHKDTKTANGRRPVTRQNIIMIGATQISALYMKLLEACSPGEYQVIAILDDRSQFVGRSVAGVRILTAPHQLEPVIEEFVVHGINTDRVIVGDNQDSLNDDELKEIRRVCDSRQIELSYLPEVIGLGASPLPSAEMPSEAGSVSVAPDFEVPRYFRYKQVFDFFAALAIIVVLFPLVIVAAALTLLDVGSPVLFWQQRIGQGGRKFMLQKFRTLLPPYDWRGQPVPNRKKISVIGKLLRQTRIDELPQLLNVLVGDMALIGPRPLLPEDQPLNPVIRLMVRPGITGWAQINGGKFLTPEQKDQYDEYYIRNASLWFDLRIVFMTLKVLFRFSGRSDHEVAASQLVGFGKSKDRQSTKAVTSRMGLAPAPRVESPSFNLDTPDRSLRALGATDRQPLDAGHRRVVK